MTVTDCYCNNKSCTVQQKFPRKYRIERCERTYKVRIYRFGNHSSIILVNKQHGMSKTVKEIIEGLIYNYNARPQRIHIRLNRPNVKQHIDRSPTLKQIQDYINNRRAQIGDQNNLDELESYVEALVYKPDITNDNELFAFGADLVVMEPMIVTFVSDLQVGLCWKIFKNSMPTTKAYSIWILLTKLSNITIH
jgi:hypothetical protein